MMPSTLETRCWAFKAEESAQSITSVRRLASPEENNERQQIHEHVSVPLGEN